MIRLFGKSKNIKSEIIILKSRGLREGWQRKSSVERSGTEIAANDLTEFSRDCLVCKIVLNEGTPKKKWEKFWLLGKRLFGEIWFRI